MDGETIVSKNDYDSLFKIDDDGVFQILEFDKVYKNYHVYFDVFNSAIWSKY